MTHLHRGAGGIAIEGIVAERFAPFGGPVLARVTVAIGDVAAPPADAQPIWEVTASGAVAGGARQALFREGAIQTLVVDNIAVLALDVDRGTAVVGPLPGSVIAQLVSAFVVPVLAINAGAAAVHASAALGPTGAVLFVAPSGAGKSSLVLGLARRGWRTLSEDVCVVDTDAVEVWPGPPWVRLHAGSAVAEGWPIVDERTDKVTIDVRERHGDERVPIERVVLVGPPGGREIELEPIGRPRAVAELPQHITWLGHPDERAEHAFPVATALATRLPISRLQVPFSPRWVDIALDALDGS